MPYTPEIVNVLESMIEAIVVFLLYAGCILPDNSISKLALEIKPLSSIVATVAILVPVSISIEAMLNAGGFQTKSCVPLYPA